MLPLLFKNFKSAARKRNLYAFGLWASGQDVSWIADQEFTSQPITTVKVTSGVYELSDGSGSPISPASAPAVYVNGVRMIYGVAFLYTGSTITFQDPYVPGAQDLVFVEQTGGIQGPPGERGFVTPGPPGPQGLPGSPGSTTGVITYAIVTATGVPGQYLLTNSLGQALTNASLTGRVFSSGLRMSPGVAYTLTGNVLQFLPGFFPAGQILVEV